MYSCKNLINFLRRKMPRFSSVICDAINNTKENPFVLSLKAFQDIFYFPVEIIFRDSKM